MLQATGGRGLRGIVVNTGCANAVTGAGGVRDAEEMARVAGRSLSQTGGSNKEDESCLVMSTGVIGQRCVHGFEPNEHFPCRICPVADLTLSL